MAQGTRKKEINYLRKAARITRGIFAVISERIKYGASEREIACDIEAIIKRKGLKRSFKTIVASGPNAAKPHAKITDRKIAKNDVVVVDFGVVYKGFCSDMTRTVIVGKASPLMRKLRRAVKYAHSAAIRKVRPGVKISKLVSEAHGYIRKKGLGKYILHTLGHGLGKKIHQAPKLSEKNNRTLKEDMVITIEPGLYVKRKGGVRTEDMILITRNGHEVLTR
ncbi:MAG: M24 family metallopeptidase [Candidatus Omnitrophica bacterium]|nr:M24 family metallopeptidase [Candidatus Omnitrophota bacterium]